MNTSRRKKDGSTTKFDEKHQAEQKRVEEALKQSEHYFRLLAEMVPQAIWVMSKGGEASFSNKRALERFGELEQAAARWQQIVHPDDWAAIIGFREQKQDKERTLEAEVRMWCIDTNSYRWQQFYVSPVWEENERTEEWIVTVTDIDDLKRAEEESRQNEEKLRWLTDAMPHLVWETSADDANIEYANQRWADYRGIRQIPIPTPTSEGFAHSDDIEKTAEERQRTMKAGESFEGEFRIQRVTDGMYRWHLVRSQPIKDSEGKITSWLGTATDIHDSKEAQELLKQSEQNFRLLAEALPQVVWTARPDGWLDYYNQKWFDYTGTTLEQTQGWSWESVLHPDDLQQCVDAWTHSFQTGEAYQVEYRLKRAADGMYRWHLGRALPLRDQQGQIIKWVGTGTDIHDWKSAQEQLAHLLQNEQTLRAEAEATNERLEQMNRVQSDFISIVSHEFRTTLTGIQGFSELLCGEDFSPEEVRDYAGDIYSDAKRLTRMINDLLDLERLKSGKMSLKPEAVNINAILREVADRARSSTSQHILTLALDHRIPIFWADTDKLIQVMTNLSSNAIKYSPNGGEIVLASKREKNTVHISVRDYGMGIPENALEEVFSPYSRIDAQRTRYIKGTGLGLAIVRQIIDMHEGHVWVESELGKGSTFHAVLPLKIPETKTETEKA
jgi:PAS domain S-box-containing protein